jgi:hypothetical protein
LLAKVHETRMQPGRDSGLALAIPRDSTERALDRWAA